MKKAFFLAGLSCFFLGNFVFAQDAETHFPLASPDGHYLVKTEDRGTTKMRLVEKSGGKTLASLGQDELGQWSVDEARWSPDSRIVVMTANRTKITDLYIYRKDGNGFTEVEEPNWPDDLFEKEMAKHGSKLRHDGIYTTLGKWRGNNQLELKLEQTTVDDNTGDEPTFHKTVILTVPPGKEKASVSVSGEKPKEEAPSAADVADKQLNEVYGRLRQKLSAAGKEHLKDEERQWLTQRDQLSDAAEKPRFVEARVKELQKRLDELK